MTKITNEQINEIAESMPGYPDEFNWREFAHKLLGLQEHTILELQVELAKVKKSRKKWRNRAIANLADNAASDAVDSLKKMSIGGNLVKVDAGEEKQEQAAKTLTHNGKTYPVGVWINWLGGTIPPIPDGVRHQVMFRDDEIEQSVRKNASSWSWRRLGDGDEIIAFMIL